MTKRLVVTHEDKLRAGWTEQCRYGNAVMLYLYWEAHYDDKLGEIRQDFCIEQANGDKQYIPEYEVANALFAKLERDFVIAEMARALVPKSDTVRIMKPPTFKI